MKPALLLILTLLCSCGGTDIDISDLPQDTTPIPGAPVPVKDSTLAGLVRDNRQKMINLPSANDGALDLARLLKIHHHGTLDLCKLMLAKSNDAPTLALARKELDWHTKAIEKLDQWETAHRPTTTDSKMYQAVQETVEKQTGSLVLPVQPEAAFRQLIATRHRVMIAVHEHVWKPAALTDAGLEPLLREMVTHYSAG